MLRKKQIRTTKGKINKILPAILLGISCILAGYGPKQACTKQTALQMPVSYVFGQTEVETDQAVLSAFRQNKTGQSQTEQDKTKQAGSEAKDAETVTASEEGLQEQKTVSGNTISALEIELDKVFEQVNEARKEIGLTELVWSDDLADAADIRAGEICKTFSHTRPDGSEWWTVNEHIIYGENLAKGYQSADSVMEAWMNSAEHKDNILYSGFQSIGIAIYEVDGKWYWAQEFGY